MLKRSNLLKIVFVFFIAALAPLSASSSTFSFTFAFPSPSNIPELPALTELASNQSVQADITVPVLTTIAVYKLRQTNPVNVVPGLIGVPRLYLERAALSVSPQSYNAAGTLLGTVNFSGSFFNSLGITEYDPVNMVDVPNYYAFLPFSFYIGSDGSYSGIGPYVGTSNVLYLTSADGGLYRLQAAPEPSTWIMMLLGFAGVAFAGFRLRRAPINRTW